MSDTSGINSTGNQNGDDIDVGDLVDTGLSDDIQSPLTAQGSSGRETIEEIAEEEDSDEELDEEE